MSIKSRERDKYFYSNVLFDLSQCVYLLRRGLKKMTTQLDHFFKPRLWSSATGLRKVRLVELFYENRKGTKAL